jgi:hypothetical protein
LDSAAGGPTGGQMTAEDGPDADDRADGRPGFAGKTGHAGRRPAPPPPAFGPDDGLTGKQGRAVEALLREPTAARAAALAGVNERTIRRWGREPAFRAALLRGRRDAFGQAVGLTQRYAPVAVATLVKVMQDPAAGASAKVAAAAVLLRLGREGVELDDLGERVERLEERAAAPAKSVVSRAVEPEAGDTPAADDTDDDDFGDEDEDGGEENDGEGEDEADGEEADGDAGEGGDVGEGDGGEEAGES